MNGETRPEKNSFSGSMLEEKPCESRFPIKDGVGRVWNRKENLRSRITIRDPVGKHLEEPF